MSSFRKKKQYPYYITVGSNHPGQIFKHIPNCIMNRLSTNSFIDIFTQNKLEYEAAQKTSTNKAKHVY